MNFTQLSGGGTSFLKGFLPLLYVINPKESSFERLEHVPNYIAEAVPYFLILVFLEIIIRWFQGLPKVRINDTFGSLANAMLFDLFRLVASKAFGLTLYVWVYERFCLFSLPWDSPITWFVGFLGIDCGYYWAHRMTHEINLFWALHQVHHSSEEYNLSTALRQPMFQRFFTAFFYLPLALVMPPTHFLVHEQMNLIYQFWIHTECISTLGPLEYILNTPSHHRVHHGRNRYCIDKNYAGVLIIWDRMFGTFEPEGDKIYYGLVHSLNSFNPLWSQMNHFEYIIKTLWNMKGGLSHRLSFLFKGPGWSPGKPRLGLPQDIPEVPKDIVPYHRLNPMWLDAYILIHFALMVIASDVLTKNNSVVPYLFAVGGVIYLVLSLTSIGMIYDHQ
jgi:alkylglycerol monooxygenase